MLKMKLVTRKAQLFANKEPAQHFKSIADLQRHFSSRYDDVILLRSLSENRAQRLRVQSAIAEKSTQEAMMREEWRTIREEALLIQLSDVRFEGMVKKK